jgi:hypothetical protein
MQNKFIWNPLEKIYALGLTKSLFMHYFHCIKFQEVKSLRNYLQTSMHVPILNLFKQDNGIIYSLYKIPHILFRLICLVMI